MPDLEETSDTLPNDGIFNGAYDDDEDVGAVADFNNMDNTIVVSPIPTLRIHKEVNLKDKILGDPTSAVQTRGKIQKASSAQQALKNPRLYHKPYKMKAELKQCKRNCFSSNYRRFGYLLIYHMGKRSKDKYVADILKKFDFWSIRTATTPIESNKPLVKRRGVDVRLDVQYLQFWTTAKSRTINNISYIDATVAGKSMTISEASIRSDLIFDDVDDRFSLNRIRLYFIILYTNGDEGRPEYFTFKQSLFTPQWKFLFHTMNHCISSKSTSWDQILTNIATTVICLATNQKYNFSKLVFGGMLRHLDATKKFVMYPRFLQIFLSNQLKDVLVPLDYFPVPTLTKKDDGKASERPSDSQPIPSPPHPSEDQPQTQTDPSPRPSPSIAIPDSNPDDSGGNHGGQSSNDISLSGNEDGLALQSVYDLYVSLCKQSVALKTRLARKTSLKKKGVQKEYVSKQGRKSVKNSKGEPSVHKDPAFDDLDDDAIDYIETEDAQDEGRTSSVMLEEKESVDKKVSTEAPVSTIKPNEGTDKRNKGTDKQDGGTDNTKVSTDRQGEGTADQNEGKNATQTAPTITSTPTPTIFGDDETIAQVLTTMSQNKQKEKEKGV
ncbi:hypothetical protein Tco_1028661 [Tanacetum coccineum]|uniref:Uncharacterized protein n=1 Tax=Tanacetum coccineum TaxID=301880 RepID=A0ABQ5G2L8_9ASTR